MDQLKALRYFAKVAETGSFTRSAAFFSVPASSLSRRIADLEKNLGATLLTRSTRSVQLTEIGQVYFQRTQESLDQLEQNDEAVRAYQTKPQGRISISAMTAFAEHMVLPLLDEFQDHYPDILLDLSLTDELTTLGRDQVDIAIRGGYPPNERVQAIRLMGNEFIPVASRDYLKINGTPKSVFELKDHKALFYRTPNGRAPWICEVDGEWQDVSGIPVAVSNSSQWLGNLVRKGLGITMAPRWLLADQIDSGELQELFFNPTLRISQNADPSIYLLYQKQRYQVPKVKVSVDFFTQRLQVTQTSRR